MRHKTDSEKIGGLRDRKLRGPHRSRNLADRPNGDSPIWRHRFLGTALDTSRQKRPWSRRLSTIALADRILMFFASDNWAGAHPRIAAGLAAHASGFEPAYGNGALDRKVADKFSEIFEREVAVFFVATGTAANSLALASVARPGAVVFASPEAHIYTDESGAPEYLSGGSRVRGSRRTAWQIRPAQLGHGPGPFRRRPGSRRPAGCSLDHPGDRGQERSTGCMKSPRSRMLRSRAACRCIWTARGSLTRLSRSAARQRI